MTIDDLSQRPQIGVFISEAQRCCALHNYPKAIAACTRALDLDADNVDVRLLRARCHMHAGHISESLEDVHHILQGDPSNHHAHFCLSEILFQAAEFEQSCVNLYRCVELRPDVRSYLQSIKRSEEALRSSCKFSMRDMDFLLDLLESGILIENGVTKQCIDASAPNFHLWQVPSIKESLPIEEDSPNLSASLPMSKPTVLPSTPKIHYIPTSRSFISNDIAFFESLSDINCIRDLVSSGLEYATQRDAFWSVRSPRSVSAPKTLGIHEVRQPLSPLSRSKSTRSQDTTPHDLRDIMEAVEAQRPDAALQRCNTLLKRCGTLNPRVSLFARLIQQCALLSLGNTTCIGQLRNLMKLSVRYPDIYMKVAYHLAWAILTSSPAESVSLAQSIRTIPAAQRNPVLIGYTYVLETRALHILSHSNTQRSARITRTALQSIAQKSANVTSSLIAAFEFFSPRSPEELLAEVHSIIEGSEV